MTDKFLEIEKPESPGNIGNLLKKGFVYDDEISSVVSGILSGIKDHGRKALFGFCRKYDGINVKKIDDIKVNKRETDAARGKVTEMYPELVKAIKIAVKNIERYHMVQLDNEPKTWSIQYNSEKGQSGKMLGQIFTPLNRIGLYIPGGRFIYPSSVLMCAIPAKIAGVKEIAVCTPPQKDGKINEILLYLFDLLKITEIYKIGGAHAVGVLAYGTEDVKRVDKIAGPGNIYVTTAKKFVFGTVGIDSLAGPSEIVIIADETSKPGYIAADLLAQAEHDPDARCILLTNSREIAEKVIDEIYIQLEDLKKSYGARISLKALKDTLKRNCRIFFNYSVEFLIDICNDIAPEHLEIMVKDYDMVLKKIKNAGAIFLGDFSPVAAGDYICGTNHVIPTGGNARFSSPLGVYDFCKKSSLAYYSCEFLKREAKHIEVFADFENLIAHKNSIEIRFKKGSKDEP